MTGDETAIRELGARIDDLETAVRDLRHAVSELGRRLAMDLPQVLARHRDAIVDALTPVAPPTMTSLSSPPATGVHPVVTELSVDGGARPDIADPPPPAPERPPEFDGGDEQGPDDADRSRRPFRRRRGAV